ncbi:TPA: phage portal protein [Clostridium botulinum]|uniref:phage portal protein n=1 Tax=Clostridium botulinum TaxID=1491 RepID=UPI001C9B636C|nr:phage portal protein [Clostridium botulinum]MBY6888769.1 phage portal protein [Clostridium botulinum]HBJ2609717.1 phage portal protein [Clostridium botulinum]
MGIWNKIKSFIKAPFKTRIIRDYSSGFSFFNTDLATNETIFSAVSLLSNTMGSLPLKLYKDYEIAKPGENDLARMIEYNPTSYMTMLQWVRCMETLKNTKGNSYAIKEYDYMHQPTKMHILNPDFVTPIIEKDTKELWYEIRDEDGLMYVHNSHIIHFSHISVNGYKGINPLDVLRNTIDYDREIKEFSLNQMKNGLKANIVIKLGAKLNKDAMNEYTEMIGRFQKNGILFVDQGKEFQELKNSSFIDPKVFDVENITIARVARVYNIPLHKLLAEKQGYSSAEQADLEYIKDTILPIIRQYEEELNKKLLTEQQRNEGYSFKFNLNGLARADMKTRGDFYFKGIRSAWFTPNEIRALEEMPPRQGGDQLFVSRDLIPVDKIDLLLKGGDKNVK